MSQPTIVEDLGGTRRCCSEQVVTQVAETLFQWKCIFLSALAVKAIYGQVDP